ncbi:recombinase RecT [Romboutsia weinsteinii]|uniref:Recombinase RecT n=1 Tax=Romboutsia weinsteinii TaxID=2020949 RepID=A0A371J6L7_9FIRM|nr:recombinase RecT [Romboutsia weinsteinii]RDY28431.1 recombinase RecT [Romboutsia weinsteinii]
MANLKETLKNNEAKGSNISINPSYAMKQLIVKMNGEIGLALPKELSSERFQKVSLTAFNSNPKLQNCEPMTFIAAMMQSAQLGLEPNTPLGQAYLIPHKVKGIDKVQFQIGYKGLLELAHRSGKLKTLYAHEVKENDEFDIDYGLEQKLIHKPLLKGDRGEVIGYYAVYHLDPSGYSFVFMTYDEVENHGKKYSNNFEGGIWEKEFDSMAKKTVIKKLLKYAPLSIEMQRAVVFDESIKQSIDSDMLLVDAMDESIEEDRGLLN